MEVRAAAVTTAAASVAASVAAARAATVAVAVVAASAVAVVTATVGAAALVVGAAAGAGAGAALVVVAVVDTPPVAVVSVVASVVKTTAAVAAAAGLGGAIFNHRGTLTIINTTLTGNTAQGGKGANTISTNTAGSGGSGFGAAIFNLNGTVTITSSTLAANTVTKGLKGTGGIGTAFDGQADGGALYNLAYGNKIEDGTASTSTVAISNSILATTSGGTKRSGQRQARQYHDARHWFATQHSDYHAQQWQSGDGAHGAQWGNGDSGPDACTANPNLGTLAVLSNCVAGTCKPAVLPLLANSPALNAAMGTSPATDQTGTVRPQGSLADLAPTITPTPTEVCANSTGNQASGPAGASSYAWTIMNGTITSATNLQTISYTAGATGNVTLNLTVTNASGCSASNSTLVTINQPPLVTMEPLNQNANPGDMITFNAAASGSPTPTVQWQVSTDGGMMFNDLPGEMSTTLSFTAMLSQNGYRYRAVFTNTCNTATTKHALLSLCTPPAVTTQPAAQIVGTGATVSFTAAASGAPAPTVQWQVDTGSGFNDLPLATHATLTLPHVTAAMNGYRYQAVFTNDCGTDTSQPALLTVNPFKVDIGDPLLCLNANGLVGVTATVTNNNAAVVTAVFTATLPTTLNGLPGTGVASLNQAGLTVTAAAVTLSGTIPPNTTVIINYKAQIAAGTPLNMPICIDSDVTFNGGPKATVQECKTLGCPAGPVNVAVSDQKAGSLLVFPYYVSKAAEQKDTRLTISNIGEKAATVHLFFIDGTSCNQADQFLCLTPNASFAFKASEYDPDATGWLLAVAVDAQGRPVQYNGLLGNAFVNDGSYVDNYGAEAFWANSPLVATLNNDTATLFFDNQSYDAVPNQFAIELQSPVDAAGQRVVTVGLQGDLTTSKLTGAAQVGTGQVINGNEKPFGSFSAWLLGSCQAQATILTTSPRVPNGMHGMIPSGQVGTMKLNIGAGVGLLLTPRTATWKGIRTSHKTGLTTTTLTIPVVIPVC